MSLGMIGHFELGLAFLGIFYLAWLDQETDQIYETLKVFFSCKFYILLDLLKETDRVENRVGGAARIFKSYLGPKENYYINLRNFLFS